MNRRPYTSVSSQRQIDHLNPRHEQHREDQKRFRDSRSSLNWMEDSCSDYLHEEKFEFLRGGVILDKSGRALSSPDFDELMSKMIQERNFYWAAARKNGMPAGMRKRSTVDKKTNRNRAVQQMPITFRPDHSLALFKMAKAVRNESEQKELRRIILNIIQRAVKFFKKETGYEVIATAVHPAEGCLHFHIIYTTINAENTLLHEHKKCGNKKIPTAGLPLIGVTRMHDNGIELRPNGFELSQKFMERRIKGGKLPVDLKVSQYLDGMIELVRERTKAGPFFDDAYALWKSAKSGKWKSRTKARPSSEQKINMEKLDFER